MRTACHYCSQRMDVPDVYLDREIRCISCHKRFVPNSPPESAQPTSGGNADQTTEDGPDWKLFQGVHTDHRVLVEMCEEAKAAGKQSQFNYLAAYCNAHTALKRDTWQAAAFEWCNARELLSEVTNRRSAQQVQRAREVFRQLASDQLIDFAKQLEEEFKQYNSHLPERALRHQNQGIANAFRKLVADRYRDLIDPSVARQIERQADRWMRGQVLAQTTQQHHADRLAQDAPPV